MVAREQLPAPFSSELIAEARALAAGRNMGATAALDELSALPPAEFLAQLAATFHYESASIDDLHRWQPVFELLPFAESLRTQLLLFRDETGALRLVFGDPFARDRLAWADERIAAPFTWTLAHHADIAAYLTRHEETLSAVESLLPAASAIVAATAGAEDLSFKSITEDASPVVKLVRSTLYDALKAEASDIHLETGPNGLGIKYRVDGVLVSVGHLPGGELAEQVISRVKVMAELDISERRVPQDGRFKVSVRGREIDFRVSIMPSIFGEDAVLRILDKQQLADEVKGLTLESIGFDIATRTVVRKLASEPYGMLLITGPTGSGKTTTLYAAISEINHGRDKIITIEDPVEYQLPGVLQIPVNEKKGLTFARGLRSILRHDPDRVMVGEIRDAETA
ncbi:MAG TPA: GspE/PulE family protein, partial [Burkholderiales bacterium]|nr:GspE/PulE family protein [Burkholderiales bacterium]